MNISPSKLFTIALAVTSAMLFVEPAASSAPLVAPKSIRKAAARAARRPLPGLSRADTAHLLLAIAEHESRFSPAVVRCSVKGDEGKAHGAYQLHPETFGSHTSDEVCSSDDLQARLALEALRGWMRMKPGLGVRGAVRGFASGTAERETRASKEIWVMWLERKGKGRKT